MIERDKSCVRGMVMGSKVGVLVLAVAAGVTMLACAPLTRPSATTGGGASGGG